MLLHLGHFPTSANYTEQHFLFQNLAQALVQIHEAYLAFRFVLPDIVVAHSSTFFQVFSLHFLHFFQHILIRVVELILPGRLDSRVSYFDLRRIMGLVVLFLGLSM